MINRMNDSFSSRSTIHVWEISVCQVDLHTLISSLGTNSGGLVFVWMTQDGDFSNTVVVVVVVVFSH